MNSASVRQLYKGFEKRVIAKRNSLHSKYGAFFSPVAMAWCAVLLFLYVGIFMTLMVIPKFGEDAERAIQVHQLDANDALSAIDTKKQADAEALKKNFAKKFGNIARCERKFVYTTPFPTNFE
jgi:hypothetical protein